MCRPGGQHMATCVRATRSLQRTTFCTFSTVTTSRWATGYYIIVLRDPERHNPDFDWLGVGVETTDEGFGGRMRCYSHASLLYKVIDGLAEYLRLDTLNPLLTAMRRDKRAAFSIRACTLS